MSKFLLLCANTTLWDPTTRATWGSLNFCRTIIQFQVCTITQTQLTTLSQAGAWGEVEKPWLGMAFLMIARSNNAGGDQVFNLAAVWVHLHQSHLSTLVEAALKLMLLVDTSQDWLYTFTCMNVAHAPVQWRTYQCYDRWYSQYKCLQSTSPATDVEVAATWWICGVPRGT